MSSRKSVGSINLHSEANKKYHLVWKYFSKVILTFLSVFLSLHDVLLFSGRTWSNGNRTLQSSKVLYACFINVQMCNYSTISSNIVYYVSCLKRPPSHRSCNGVCCRFSCGIFREKNWFRVLPVQK